MNWASQDKQDRSKTFLNDLKYLKLIIQEHQIKPMHRYVKRVDEAKTKLLREMSETKKKLHGTHEKTQEDTRECDEFKELFEVQLLQFLQRPTINIDIDIELGPQSCFALQFGSEKDIGVEVRNWMIIIFFEFLISTADVSSGALPNRIHRRFGEF
jgi:hypothetical protein